MKALAAAVALLLTAPWATAQPTSCVSRTAGYNGPCYHGVLPAFFDDFEYASAKTSGAISGARPGDLFGVNAWRLAEGTERTRAWYRYNRDDLPIPGSITFDAPSTMRMALPRGLDHKDFSRSSIINTDFASAGGTYAWRVKLSELWEGQRLRQTVWAMSNNSYLLDYPLDGTMRSALFWSELDFENENHFQGEKNDGLFRPDFVTRMSVGNHFGQVRHPQGDRRLGRNGPSDPSAGRGKLARNGFARGDAAERAPLLDSWAEEWVYLIINIDSDAQTVTYRMIPERESGGLAVLNSTRFIADRDFFPRQAMHPAFSLHWVKPEGRLRNELSLEADWLFYTPVEGLQLRDILAQVAYLRTRDIPRMNTTGVATYHGHAASHPIAVSIVGPRQVPCSGATWTVDVERLGRYYVTFRYRFVREGGRLDAWQAVHEPTLTLAPRPGYSGVEIEAVAQDLWISKGNVRRPNGGTYPHPDNQSERVSAEATFACSRN